MTEDQRVSPLLFETGLQTCDESVIQFVLGQTSVDQIPFYIKPLSSHLIPTFLKTFNRFIATEPNSLQTVLPWISSLIDIHQISIQASGESQRRLSDLQQTLKQRTQQIGLFIEAYSSTQFIQKERDGKGVGLPITDDDAQEITEE